MSKKKKIKIIVISLIVLIVLILFENGIRFLATRVSENKAKENKTYEQRVDEKKEETEKKVNTSVEELVSFIKNKEYEKAYAKLDDTYRGYRFPELEDFKEYIDGLVKENTVVEVIKFTENSINIDALVRFSTGDDVHSENIFLLKVGDTYTYRFENTSSITEMLLEKKNNSFDIAVKYNTRAGSMTSYVVEISNKTNNNITLQKDRCVLQCEGDSGEDIEKSITEVSGNTTIKGQSKERVELIYMIGQGGLAVGKELSVVIETADGNTYKYDFDVGENVDEGLIGA